MARVGGDWALGSQATDGTLDVMTVLPLLIPLEGFDHGSFLEPPIGLGGFLVVVAILITGLLLLRRFGFLPHMLSSLLWPSSVARRLRASAAGSADGARRDLG